MPLVADAITGTPAESACTATGFLLTLIQRHTGWMNRSLSLSRLRRSAEMFREMHRDTQLLAIACRVSLSSPSPAATHSTSVRWASARSRMSNPLMGTSRPTEVITGRPAAIFRTCSREWGHGSGGLIPIGSTDSCARAGRSKQERNRDLRSSLTKVMPMIRSSINRANQDPPSRSMSARSLPCTYPWTGLQCRRPAASAASAQGISQCVTQRSAGRMIRIASYSIDALVRPPESSPRIGARAMNSGAPSPVSKVPGLRYVSR